VLIRGYSDTSANRSRDPDNGDNGDGGSVGEDISVLTCDEDLYAGAGNGASADFDDDKPSGDGYSPKAYLSSPASAFLHEQDNLAEVATPRSVPKQSISRSASTPAFKQSSTPASSRSKSDRMSISPTTDVVWLIQTLRPEGNASREDKKKAVSDLKKLAKTASPEFWQRNCAQVKRVMC
jgi:hypothetical protein